MSRKLHALFWRHRGGTGIDVNVFHLFSVMITEYRLYLIYFKDEK